MYEKDRETEGDPLFLLLLLLHLLLLLLLLLLLVHNTMSFLQGLTSLPLLLPDQVSGDQGSGDQFLWLTVSRPKTSDWRLSHAKLWAVYIEFHYANVFLLSTTWRLSLFFHIGRFWNHILYTTGISGSIKSQYPTTRHIFILVFTVARPLWHQFIEIKMFKYCYPITEKGRILALFKYSHSIYDLSLFPKYPPCR